MRLHLLVAAAVLAAPLPIAAQDAPIQRWPSREASPQPQPDRSSGGAQERTAVPREAPPARAPERSEPRAAEPRQSSPPPDRDNRSGSRDAESRDTFRRWPARDGAAENAGSRDRVAVRRPDTNAPAVAGGGRAPVWNVANGPYQHPYVYYPQHLYPYGYGAFGLGYFYYYPYAWHSAPLYSYSRGFYGRSYEEAFDSGKLQLKVSPRDAQVYVDGYFAGTVNDYDGVFQALRLEAGTYHVQLVLPGFRTLEFDVRIAPGQKITYAGELQREP